MEAVFDNICIRGISAVVPSIIEENSMAEEFLGVRRCKKQIKLTGIERRHISPPGQRVSDLCYVAAKKLIEKLQWSVEDIKILVLLTQTPNYVCPSTSFLLHKMLGLSKDCIVFDVNFGCSAFNMGLQIVSSMLQQFPGNAKGLCLEGDLEFKDICPGVPPDVMAGQMLFGSCGSATAIEKIEGVNCIPVAAYSDGNRYQAIMVQRGKRPIMDGEGVYNFATNDVVDSINEFFTVNAIKSDDVDYYVFHQAQKLILDNIIHSCNIPAEKELRSNKDYGNTRGASVPLSICANRKNLADGKDFKFFTCGFGIGLSWCMAYTTINSEGIIPVILSDDIFGD